MQSRISQIARVLPLILLLTATVSAQTFRGTILGTVTDPNGALVAGAKVSVRNTSTGLERSTTTDEDGNYTVAELPIGPYEVRIEQSGFMPSVVSNVTVEVASERRVDVKLNIAGTDTIVTIATNVQVETTTNTLGGTITTKAAEDLPINGRDFTKFLVTVPVRPAILQARPTRPVRSVCSARTAIADVPTTIYSTAPT